MAKTAQRILDTLASSHKPLDDDQLAALLGVRRQAINQVCRRLDRDGQLQRHAVSGAKIVNVLRGTNMPIVEAPVPMTGSSEFLSEDEVKGGSRITCVPPATRSR